MCAAALLRQQAKGKASVGLGLGGLVNFRHVVASKARNLTTAPIIRDRQQSLYLLPKLPYAQNALAPHISAETMQFHHGGHLQAYVNKLNELTADKPHLRDRSVEDIIASQSGVLFNQAAQVWNHNFYFHCMAPPEVSLQKAGGRPEPPSPLREVIIESFGSFDKFCTAFTQAALGHFGSGWAWLVLVPRGGHEGLPALKIVTTHDAMTPLRDGSGYPLLACDVWEHAYYVDYRNARAKYMQAFWNVVNWKFVARNFEEAMKRSQMSD